MTKTKQLLNLIKRGLLDGNKLKVFRAEGTNTAAVLSAIKSDMWYKTGEKLFAGAHFYSNPEPGRLELVLDLTDEQLAQIANTADALIRIDTTEPLKVDAIRMIPPAKYDSAS